MDFKIKLTKEEYIECNNFAEKSSKTQREYRSGGTQVRNIWMIKNDTLRGKVAEVFLKKFLEQEPFNIKGIELDFNIYPRGVWDEQDFKLNDKKISIKSAKWFSKWLLLESKDIKRGDLYDYYVLVLVDKDYKSGEIKGFATKDEVLTGKHTIKLSKGECIPNTTTLLDADNHAIYFKNLHNTKEDWIKFKEKTTSN